MLKMILVILNFLTFPLLAETASTTQKVDLKLLGKVSEENFKKANVITPVPSKTEDKKDTSKVSFSCNDSSGNSFQPGMPGYADCVSGIKKQFDAHPSKGESREQNKNNTGTLNFKFGK